MRARQGGGEEVDGEPPPVEEPGGDGGSGGQEGDDDDDGIAPDEDEDDEDEDAGSVPGMARGLFVRERSPSDAKVIVVANSLFLLNDFVGISGNLNFFATVIDRLTTGGRLSAIRHRSSEAPAIRADLTSGEKSAIKYVGMIGMPALVALAGVAVSLLRRRRRVAVEGA